MTIRIAPKPKMTRKCSLNTIARMGVANHRMILSITLNIALLNELVNANKKTAQRAVFLFSCVGSDWGRGHHLSAGFACFYPVHER